MYISLNQLHNSKKIHWIKSFSTLRNKVEPKGDYNKIIKPRIKENKGTARRFFIKKENVEKLINAYNSEEII